MLDRNPSNRPTAKECLARLGEEWVARDAAMQFNVGTLIPADWQEGQVRTPKHQKSPDPPRKRALYSRKRAIH